MKEINYKRNIAEASIEVYYGKDYKGAYKWTEEPEAIQMVTESATFSGNMEEVDKVVEYKEIDARLYFLNVHEACEYIRNQYPPIPDETDLEFNYNDGGRSKYFNATHVGDCVTRAIAIASGMDYKEVYNLFYKVSGRTPRNGVEKKTIRKVMQILGAVWTPCMKIGSGCTCHLRKNEIPMEERIVCSLSGHLTAVINGVVNDTYDCTRGGERCVYGYWIFK